MHLNCCLLIVCLSTTINMTKSTTSTPPPINLNPLFDIEKDSELASQIQVINGSQEVSNL
jgi:hypothetical protein